MTGTTLELKVGLEAIAGDHLEDVWLGSDKYAVLIGAEEYPYMTTTESSGVCNAIGTSGEKDYLLDALILSLQGKSPALAVLENDRGSALLYIVRGAFYYASDDYGGVPVQLAARQMHRLTEGSILSMTAPYDSRNPEAIAWRVGKQQTT